MSSLLADPTLAAMKDIISGVVFTIFVISALLVTIVILLQEGKGGGLGGAFGGAAADAFGVKAGSVNRFTAYLAAAFLGLALLYAGLTAGTDKISTTIDTSPGASGAPDGDAVPGGGGSDDATPPEDGTPIDGSTPPEDSAPGNGVPGDEASGDAPPDEGAGDSAPEQPEDPGAAGND